MAYQWTTADRTIVKCLDTGVSFPRSHRLFVDIERDGIPVQDPPAVDLAVLKRELCARIEQDAGRRRRHYSTDAFAKMDEYAEAAAEALRVFKMGAEAANALADHGRADFPVLSASVPFEAATLFAAAELVADRREAAAEINGDIKRDALAGRTAVMAATTEAEANAAYGAIQWSR